MCLVSGPRGIDAFLLQPQIDDPCVAGSLACGAAVDGFRPDAFDVIGAAVCLVGVVVIMYAPQ